MTRQRLDQHIDMVRHDAPFEQAIALAIEMKQRLLHDLGDTRIAEVTLPMPGVFVGVETSAQFGGAVLWARTREGVAILSTRYVCGCVCWKARHGVACFSKGYNRLCGATPSQDRYLRETGPTTCRARFMGAEGFEPPTPSV